MPVNNAAENQFSIPTSKNDMAPQMPNITVKFPQFPVGEKKSRLTI
jgi:hypothetical protein